MKTSELKKKKKKACCLVSLQQVFEGYFLPVLYFDQLIAIVFAMCVWKGVHVCVDAGICILVLVG